MITRLLSGDRMGSRALAVILALIQTTTIATFLQGQPGLVMNPGIGFIALTSLTLTTGTIFIMWLGEQITDRGVGNGISLIILAGIVAELPSAIAGTLELGRQGALSTGIILAVVLMAVVVIGFIVFMERAQRRLLMSPARSVYSVKRFMGRGIDDVRDEAALLPFGIGGEAGGVVRIGVAGREFTPPEISAFVLKELKHRAEEFFRTVGSRGFERDVGALRERAGRAYDRSFYPRGFLRQLAAILATPPRTAALGEVRVPVAVIHGRQDPLIRAAGGVATARAVPGAVLHMIDGMGHDLAEGAWPLLVDAIVANAGRAAASEPSRAA